ncbi:MAG TPA: OmpA family protein, partial [Gemmatimonadales bacterium]|nr:OmpA family protein [Gemmatimonadales bacterium]
RSTASPSPLLHLVRSGGSMWGAFGIGIALLALEVGHPPVPPPVYRSGMTLAVQFPDGKKTKLPISGTPEAAMVKGTAEIEYRSGRSSIKIRLEKLPDPRLIGTFSTSYVAWVVRGDEGVESLGEVPLKQQEISGSTTARTFGLIITAEPYAAVRLPSRTVVAELTLPQPADPRLQTLTVTYEGVPEDLYESGLADASVPTPDSVTPLAVVAARRSVSIARKVEAGQYAREEFSAAISLLDSLERTWTKKPKDEKRYAELARETARRADAARELAMTRAQEAREEEERQRAEEERQRLEAAQQAALDSSAQSAARARAQAEREAQLRSEAERKAAELQARLYASVSAIMETRKGARGLIAALSGVNFETNKATLKPIAREKLSKLSGVLLGFPGEYKLEIEGHTDSTGTDAYNQKLSQARAESVRDFLVEQGIPLYRIPSTEGFGRTRPIAPNDTRVNREKNRRVDIVIE